MTNTSRAVQKAARESYGRILAYLSTRTHDIASAEDSLADAFAKALTKWPQDGVPSNPDAWLLTAARNRLTDQQRRINKIPTENEFSHIPAIEDCNVPFRDDRLALLLVCTHPAIAPDLHTPLMLQVVLGITSQDIARLFLVSPTALSKRLVRAKAKIRDSGIPFKIPEPELLPERSPAVLEAIYALHALDWLDPADGMGEEALYLADLVSHLLPSDAEVFGLCALIAFNHVRRMARIVDGALVPTEQQDMAHWDDGLIAYGNLQLRRAYELSSIGRYQLEATIDSVHLARKNSGTTDWTALNQLYHAYLKISPSAGAAVSQALISANLHGTEIGLVALNALEEQIGTEFQPIWAIRAELYSRSGQMDEANKCYDRAITLTTDLPVIKFLKNKRITLST